VVFDNVSMNIEMSTTPRASGSAEGSYGGAAEKKEEELSRT